jgi:hypothetical protein
VQGTIIRHGGSSLDRRHIDFVDLLLAEELARQTQIWSGVGLRFFLVAVVFESKLMEHPKATRLVGHEELVCTSPDSLPVDRIVASRCIVPHYHSTSTIECLAFRPIRSTVYANLG